MGLFGKIFSNLPDITEDQIVESHIEVVNSFKKISALIPDEHRHFNLLDIVLIKSYGYHTGFDKYYYRYNRIKNALKKTKVLNDYISGLIAFRMLTKHSRKYVDMYSEKTFETDFKLNRRHTQQAESDKLKPISLLFANTQTYLLVLIQYMLRSSRDNNLLIIPRSLESADVLKKISKNKVRYFEDYIDDTILSYYEDAKVTYMRIYENSQSILDSYFALDGKSFFPYVNNGLLNIFKYLLPEAVLISLTIERIFESIEISNVVGARIRKIYDRSFIRTAHRYGISSYILLHSNLLRDKASMHATGHFNDLTGVFVWGENQKKIILNDTLSNVDEIYVTGSPLFEMDPDRNNNIDNNRDSIIYACGSNDYKETKVFIISARHLEQNYDVIIKVHPHISSEKYLPYVQKRNIKIIPGTAVYEDMLGNAKIVVTLLSEAALHSMIRNIPTIFLFLDKKWDSVMDNLYDINVYEKAMFIARNGQQLFEIINKLLNSPGYKEKYIRYQKEFLGRNLYSNSSIHGTSKRIDEILC